MISFSTAQSEKYLPVSKYLSSGYFNGKKPACAFHTFMHLNLIINPIPTGLGHVTLI